MVLSQTRIMSSPDGKYVEKRYNGTGSIKWLLSPPFRMFYPFVALPESRLEREVGFLESDSDIKKPKLYSCDRENRLIKREYIDGKQDCRDGVSVGEALSSIHGTGYVLGDTKLSNFLSNDAGCYVIDAEQAIKSDKKKYRVWDATFALVSSSYYNYPEIDSFKKFVDGFASSYKYWQEYEDQLLKGPSPIFLLLLPIQHRYLYKKLLKDVIGGA